MRLRNMVPCLPAALLVLFGKSLAADSPDRALGFFLPDPGAAARLQPVIGQLESDSFATREAASRELAALPALPAFVRELAGSERQPESRLRLRDLVAAFPLATENERLTGILGEIEAKGAKGLLDPIVRVMRRGLWSPDSGALHGAARATAAAADLPLITGCLDDPSPVIRRIGVAALGGLPAGDSDGKLAALLDDPDAPAAMLAAAALAGRKDLRCLAVYARLLDAEDFLTRYHCHAALRGLSGRDFGYDSSMEADDRRAASGKWRAWAASGEAAITGSLPRDPAVVLFNGSDLQGWELRAAGKVLGNSAAWQAKDGVLRCTGAEPADLWSKTRHENYVLTLEYKVDGPAGDSGVGLLLTEAGEGGPTGPAYLEVQLLPGKAGDLYQIGGIKVEAQGAPIQFLSPRTAGVADPAGAWQKLKLTVRDGAAAVEINGVTVSRASKGPRGPGRILLRNEGHPVDFRGIVLLPLDPPAP
jgi:HEAT repeat protein